MKHIDSHLHVRGESQFVDDVPPRTGILEAAVFGSPKAHGLIEKLDLKEAEDSEGVVAVFYGKRNVPGVNRFGPIFQDEQLLVEKEVCFVGHPIAIVVAERVDLARKARDKIRVEIENLPVVIDAREAFKRKDFIHPPRTVEMGNVDSAWKLCDLVVEGPVRHWRPGASLPGNPPGEGDSEGGWEALGLPLYPESDYVANSYLNSFRRAYTQDRSRCETAWRWLWR